MMKQTFKSSLLAATAALALTACGGDDDPAASADQAVQMAQGLAGVSPVDQQFRLSNAEEVDIAGFLSSMGLDQMLQYSSAEFDADLGAAVLTDIVAPGPAGESVTMSRLELFGLNTDMISSMMAGEIAGPNGELFEKVRVFDLAASFPVEGMDGDTMGSISVGGLEFNALNVLTPDAEMMAALEGEGQQFAAQAQSVSFDGMALRDLVMAIPLGDAESGVDVNVADMRMGAYDAGTFGGLQLFGLDFTMAQSDAMIAEQAAGMGPEMAPLLNSPLKHILFPSNQRITMASMNWDGMSFAGLLGYLESGEEPPLDATDLLSIGGMEFNDQAVFMNGKRAGFTGSTTIDPIEFMHFMPLSINMVAENSIADLTAYVGDDSPEILAVLENNGLDNVTGDSSVNYAYNPRNGDITFDMEGVASGLYGIDLDIDVADFDYPALMSEDGGEMAAMNIAIEGVSLEVSDEKLLDTIFAIAGLQTGQEASALRQQLSGLMMVGALQGAQFSPRIPEYATALSQFVGNGGSLAIRVAPDSPVTVGSLVAMGENPAGLLEALNLIVTHDE